MTKEKIEYSGTLILEEGVRINFYMQFDYREDVPDWIYIIEDGAVPTQEPICITEEETNYVFTIPINKILAYRLG